MILLLCPFLKISHPLHSEPGTSMHILLKYIYIYIYYIIIYYILYIYYIYDNSSWGIKHVIQINSPKEKTF